MNNSNEEEQSTTEESKKLSVVARFFFALYSSPAIGFALGLLSSIGVSGFEGAYGYTVLYNGAILTGLTFLGLLFIGNKKIQVGLAIVAALLWVLLLFNL